MAIKEAHIVLARCPQCNRHLYGIRVEKQPDHWALTWAFPIDESKAKSEGYDETVLNGTFHPSPIITAVPFAEPKLFYTVHAVPRLPATMGNPMQRVPGADYPGKQKHKTTCR